MLWDDGNTAGNWITPFPMVVGWVLLAATTVVAVALLAYFVAHVIASGSDDGD